MARKPYTVENQRPRRTVRLYGAVLAPKGRGRTSCTDLELEEVLGDACLRLLSSGRLAVVRGDTAPVDAKLAELSGEEEPPPVVEVAPPAPEEPTVIEQPPAPEPAPVVQEEPEPAPEPEVEPEPEVAETAEPDFSDTSFVWTEEALMALNADQQKTICRSRSLKVGGREAARVQRILDAQEGA